MKTKIGTLTVIEPKELYQTFAYAAHFVSSTIIPGEYEIMGEFKNDKLDSYIIKVDSVINSFHSDFKHDLEVGSLTQRIIDGSYRGYSLASAVIENNYHYGKVILNDNFTPKETTVSGLYEITPKVPKK